MSELSTPKVEESVGQYVKLALAAPTKEERDRYVRKAAELARSQDVTWRESLKKVG
jgi:ribosome recycling factor